MIPIPGRKNQVSNPTKPVQAVHAGVSIFFLLVEVVLSECTTATKRLLDSLLRRKRIVNTF